MSGQTDFDSPAPTIMFGFSYWAKKAKVLVQVIPNSGTAVVKDTLLDEYHQFSGAWVHFLADLKGKPYVTDGSKYRVI